MELQKPLSCTIVSMEIQKIWATRTADPGACLLPSQDCKAIIAAHIINSVMQTHFTEPPRVQQKRCSGKASSRGGLRTRRPATLVAALHNRTILCKKSQGCFWASAEKLYNMIAKDVVLECLRRVPSGGENCANFQSWPIPGCVEGQGPLALLQGQRRCSSRINTVAMPTRNVFY